MGSESTKVAIVPEIVPVSHENRPCAPARLQEIDWRRVGIWVVGGGISLSGLVALGRLIRDVLRDRRLDREKINPVVRVRYEDQHLYAFNTGQGSASNIALTDSTDIVGWVDYLEPQSKLPVKLASRPSFTISSAYHLSYQDRTGRWHQTKLLGQGLIDHSDPTTTIAAEFLGPVRPKRVPRRVRERIRTQSVEEHLVQLTRWWDPRNHFRAMALNAKRARRRMIRWWFHRREKTLLEQFRPYLESPRAAVVPQEIRGTWDIDIDGLYNCPGNPQLIYQHSCKWDGDDLIAELAVDHTWTAEGRFGSIHGVLHIPRHIYDALPRNRDERNDRVYGSLLKYYCRYRPNSAFVFSLQWVP